MTKPAFQAAQPVEDVSPAPEGAALTPDQPTLAITTGQFHPAIEAKVAPITEAAVSAPSDEELLLK